MEFSEDVNSISFYLYKKASIKFLLKISFNAIFKDPKWYGGASSWLKVTPFGFRRLLKWLTQYGKPIIVTENGFSDFLGNLDDMQRIYYYKHYLNQMLKGEASIKYSSFLIFCKRKII